ncbi:hypothetical protein G647_07895 [Cladophialophora carrionii CBS 160.54]|uniref:Uncharacterized protein n=1 Tax=Cladophialophora carrionii CBS 160.54 TaxID=1279043 RepID=V9D5H7_9EURO|nr:uncharacterized protein G647_07895 [Cladophialophora carrionii CBS 160.54]ETI21548.1 hypothetical protein G647_07895 [Cladophialophora carrionii CBS 160.54]
MDLAQEAFDIFAKHCEHVDAPLASVDIPQGYASRTDDGSPGSPGANPDTDGTASSPSSSGPLSTGTMVGIATGSVVAAAGIVGAIFKCLSYRHKKKQNTSSNGGGGQNPATTNNQLVQWQPAWQGMPPGALTGDADARATYKRKEFAFAGVRRVKETFEVTRQPTPPAGAVLGRARGRGRILGEV